MRLGEVGFVSDGDGIISWEGVFEVGESSIISIG